MIKKIVKSILTKEAYSDLLFKKNQFKASFKASPFEENIKAIKKIIIIGVADYINLGDHAIGEAQRRFLDTILENNLEYKVLEIPVKTPVVHIERIIGDDDIIMFTGGGNLGTKYEMLHDIFLPIIKDFPNTQKLFFPQSFSFNKETDSEKFIEKVKKVFAESRRNLTITARESKSFKLFKETFPENNVIFTPDIVFSMNQRDKKPQKREGILMLMREDKEKVLPLAKQTQIQEALSKSFKVKLHINDSNFTPDMDKRLTSLNKKWNEIKKHELVITDRLHGMIFAQITGTPCIVFDNYNSKIKMTVNDWLSDTDNIVFIDPRENINIEKFVLLASYLCGKSVEEFKTTEKYAPLIQKINELIEY